MVTVGITILLKIIANLHKQLNTKSSLYNLLVLHNKQTFLFEILRTFNIKTKEKEKRKRRTKITNFVP